MPELAEVAYYAGQWAPGIGGRVRAVRLQAGKRIFRGQDTDAMASALRGAIYRGARTHGKNLLFQFSGGVWLGGHLGMTGHLMAIPPAVVDGEVRLHRPGAPAHADPKHHHLVLVQRDLHLVFSDPRLFGRLRFHRGRNPPRWWQDLPPEILSGGFTKERLRSFFARRRATPAKTLLLDQTTFPGIGNWMADEILWRTKTDPRTRGGDLDEESVASLWRATRQLARSALKTIGQTWARPPDSWLFNHRWKSGGRCPRCAATLAREKIGARTTCFCPNCQTQ
ncbi:bifunctional DNA-formamidopyrimidine glycosylase/DNA-(apurinic or apyrimidinic site) lyase [soil metagenome]